MGRINHDLLLVGSVPLDRAEQVLEICGRKIGKYVDCLPDGEIGERTRWVSYQSYRVFHGHPEIETLHRPEPKNGVEQWIPTGYNNHWNFKVRAGVKEVRFGDPGWRLGYARDAINSYFVFRTLRDRGDIPAGVRFQVCLPGTVSVVFTPFREAGDFDRVAPGYEEAMRAEVANIVKQIPRSDLVIQWDCALELLDVEGAIAWTPKENKFERSSAQFRNLSRAVPDDVPMGYHFCYGTLGGWPMKRPESLEWCVKFTRKAIDTSGRPVDFVHMPVPRHPPDHYFDSLKSIAGDDVKVYLGLIHHPDTVAELKTRIDAARKFIPNPGVASVCGFGRLDPDRVPSMLDDHLRAVEALHA